MKTKLKLFTAISCLVISACSDSTDYNFDTGLATVEEGRAAIATLQASGPSEAVFDPANGEIPFPNTLLFGDDGTLNLPIGDAAEDDFGAPAVALNTLDGFSTTQPVTADFSKAIDPATVQLGETVFAFKVTTNEVGLVTGVERELGANEITALVVNDVTVAFVPLVPLAESADYLFILTNGVADTDGPVSAGRAFRLVSGATPLTGDLVGALEPLRVAVNAMLAATSGQVEAANVVQAWTTKTQSITPVMSAAMNASSSGGEMAIASTGLNTNNINEALPGIADVYFGTLDIPYYLTAPANENDVGGISGFWRGQDDSFLTRFNTVPVATSQQTIPVLMTVPNANSGQTAPAAGWPIAIFVHGITRDRSDMLALADSMAQAGYAVIAIDQPMHGITDAASALNAANTPFPNDVERTFNIDLADNTTGAAGPDGVPDASGTHFFSPARLLNTRDNLRQSAADLRVLSASLRRIVAAPIDESRKALIGYSLGGTAATLFAAFDDTLSSVTLAMPAAGLVPMTLESPAFRDQILAGLEAVGLVPGTPEFSQFVVAAQTVTDGGDPINFGAQAAALHNIHMMEVVGNEAAGIPSDQTVLNTVTGAPLAGSSALARVMGLDPVSSDAGGMGEGVSGIVRFTAGDHGSLLNPAASQAVTVEMQTQVATYAVSAGALIKITDPSVILAP